MRFTVSIFNYLHLSVSFLKIVDFVLSCLCVLSLCFIQFSHLLIVLESYIEKNSGIVY